MTNVSYVTGICEETLAAAREELASILDSVAKRGAAKKLKAEGGDKATVLKEVSQDATERQ